jgi:hypothetical protein
MARIKVCDVCYHEKKLVECNRYFSVKGKPELRLDVCEEHNASTKKLPMPEYKRLVYKCKGYTEDMIEVMMK